MTVALTVAATVGVELGAVELVAPVPPVDLTPAGHRETVRWRGVDGASGATVGHASLVVSPTLVGYRSLGSGATAHTGVAEIEVRSPDPDALVRGLRIPGLVHEKGGNDRPAVTPGYLAANGLHLIVRPKVGGQLLAPVVAVPPLPAVKELPAQLTGGSLSGSLLSLPDLAGAAWVLKLVHGDSPQEFEPQAFSHGNVEVLAAPMPGGITIAGPDGATLFTVAGPVRSPITVDPTAALQRQLAAAVGTTPAGETVEAGVVVSARSAGSAVVRFRLDGVVQRAVASRLTVEAEGRRVHLPLPPPDPGRPARSAVADVTITHHGLAVHPVSDRAPTASGDLRGPVVRVDPVVRVLPPEALAGLAIGRVGVIGWPLGPTDLAVTVLGATAQVGDLRPVPGRCPPSMVWFAFERPVPVSAPVVVSLRAVRGAFAWVADPEPLVQLAVTVRPEGERVTVGSASIVLSGEETVAGGTSIGGPGGWDVDTDQFCTVTLSNLILEFDP